MAYARDKAPSHSYTMTFFIACWDVFNKVVVVKVQNFHA